MEKLRTELGPVLTTLLEMSEASMRVELDAIGTAIGSMAVSTDDIDALMRELERRGREIVAPSGGGAEQSLGRVVAAARRLKSALTRRPTLAEVAEEAKLSSEQVLIALALLRVMQRSPRDVARK
jgi:hypothetical protein